MGEESGRDATQRIHDYTYGITSDPLTQFAVILSALIHDVDHRGVGNHDLSKEDSRMAAMFENKSIAEQNSMDIAWESLMDPCFKELRQCIYTNEDELKRFRVLLVNCVMSTGVCITLSFVSLFASILPRASLNSFSLLLLVN